jgi:hypothetical protein
VDLRHPCNGRAYIVAGMCQEALDVASSVDHPHFAGAPAAARSRCQENVGTTSAFITTLEQRYEEEGGDQEACMACDLSAPPPPWQVQRESAGRKRKASAVVAR